MSENKKPAPESETYIYGNTRVELRKGGLTITVEEDEARALTPGDLGPYFKKLREDTGLTLEELADATGFSTSQIKLAEEYGFSEKDLLFQYMCSAYRLDSKEIAKKYGLGPSWEELRVQAIYDSYAARDADNRSKKAPETKPSKQYPARAMFISLMLTNVATLLLCVGQILMRLAG